MSGGFSSLHPNGCPSIPPSPSSQGDGDDKEPVEEDGGLEDRPLEELSQHSPEGDRMGGYSPLGPSAESESLGDAPLSPLIKSSLSEELSQNLLGLGLDPVTFARGKEHAGSRSGIAIAAGSTDSCFSGGGATTDRETLSTVSSYRSEKTDSTQLESPSLGKPYPSLPGAASSTGAGQGGRAAVGPLVDTPLHGGSDTDDLSDSELLQSPSKEVSVGQGLDRTLVEGEDLPPLPTDIAQSPHLPDSSPSSSGHSGICDVDRSVRRSDLHPTRKTWVLGQN